MHYRTIEYQVAEIHSLLLDLQDCLEKTRTSGLTLLETKKIKFMLIFLRKHMNKRIMMPRINNPKPRS